MNFLSHYYCLEEENPYFILGTIMPDLVKDFSKLYNLHIEDTYKPTQAQSLLMLQGVLVHVKGDDAFHKHPLFIEMQAIAKAELKKVFSKTVKRKFVIAHVLIELLIDKHIINANEAKLKSLYEKMESIDVEKANIFFSNLNIEEKTSHFKKNFTYFKELKFLFRLKENEGVIFTLHKVFSKKLKYDFLENKKEWNLAVENIYNSIEKNIPILLQEVKTKIYE